MFRYKPGLITLGTSDGLYASGISSFKYINGETLEDVAIKKFNGLRKLINEGKLDEFKLLLNREGEDPEEMLETIFSFEATSARSGRVVRSADTLLTFAIKENKPEIAEYLLSSTAIDVNQPDGYDTPLILALNVGMGPIVDMIMSRDTLNLNAIGIDNKTVLIEAIKAGRLDIFERCLAAPGLEAIINLRTWIADHRGLTPLEYAVRYNRIDFVDRLLNVMQERHIRLSDDDLDSAMKLSLDHKFKDIHALLVTRFKIQKGHATLGALGGAGAGGDNQSGGRRRRRRTVKRITRRRKTRKHRGTRRNSSK